jgi:hypothetical protein
MVCGECYNISNHSASFSIATTNTQSNYTECKHWASIFTYDIDQNNICRYIINIICHKCKFIWENEDDANPDQSDFIPMRLSCECISSVPLDRLSSKVNQSIAVILQINNNKFLNVSDVQRSCKTKTPRAICCYCDSGYIQVYADCQCANDICRYCKGSLNIPCTTYGCKDGNAMCVYCNGTGCVDILSILHQLSGQSLSSTAVCIKCNGTGYGICQICNNNKSDYNKSDSDTTIDNTNVIKNCHHCNGSHHDICKGCNGKAFIKCVFCVVKMFCLLCNNTSHIKTKQRNKCNMCVLNS